jgi:hypothetical protein
MKRCALCHGKLGLDARFRNRWNGRWWVHVRFCSVRCEAIYEVKQNDAAKHRWHAFLAHGNSRTNCLALGRVPINAPIAAPLEFLSQKCTALSGRDVDRCIRPLSRQVGAEREHVCE